MIAARTPEVENDNSKHRIVFDVKRHKFGKYCTFLANVNVSSRSLFAVARSSVVCLSVTLVCPTQAVQIFGSISTALGTLAIH